MSQVKVGCPWARCCDCNYIPKRKNTHSHRPTNPQPSHEPTPTQPPSYSTHHTEARSPVKVRCTNPQNKGKKNPRKEGETLNQESRGREGSQEKCYATRTPCHTNKAQSKTQTKCRHMAYAYAKATHCWTEICPMLPNNGKCYKCKHSYTTALQTANTPPKNAKTLETIAPSRWVH